MSLRFLCGSMNKFNYLGIPQYKYILWWFDFLFCAFDERGSCTSTPRPRALEIALWSCNDIESVWSCKGLPCMKGSFHLMQRFQFLVDLRFESCCVFLLHRVFHFGVLHSRVFLDVRVFSHSQCLQIWETQPIDSLCQFDFDCSCDEHSVKTSLHTGEQLQKVLPSRWTHLPTLDFYRSQPRRTCSSRSKTRALLVYATTCRHCLEDLASVPISELLSF